MIAPRSLARLLWPAPVLALFFGLVLPLGACSPIDVRRPAPGSTPAGSGLPDGAAAAPSAHVAAAVAQADGAASAASATALAALTPAGSAATAAAPPPPVFTAFESAAVRLQTYGERVREFGPAEIAREQVRLAEAPDDPAGRLQLVLLLAQSRQNGDMQRALQALDPLTRPTAALPWRALAKLLQDRLVEQRRLEEQNDRLNQQLREQQRRNDQLGTQLEALRAIERSINGRPPAPAAPAPTSGRPVP